MDANDRKWGKECGGNEQPEKQSRSVYPQISQIAQIAQIEEGKDGDDSLCESLW